MASFRDLFNAVATAAAKKAADNPTSPGAMLTAAALSGSTDPGIQKTISPIMAQTGFNPPAQSIAPKPTAATVPAFNAARMAQFYKQDTNVADIAKKKVKSASKDLL